MKPRHRKLVDHKFIAVMCVLIFSAWNIYRGMR